MTDKELYNDIAEEYISLGLAVENAIAKVVIREQLIKPLLKLVSREQKERYKRIRKKRKVKRI